MHVNDSQCIALFYVNGLVLARQAHMHMRAKVIFNIYILMNLFLMYLNIVWCLPNCAHKVSMNTTLKQDHLGKVNEL